MIFSLDNLMGRILSDGGSGSDEGSLDLGILPKLSADLCLVTSGFRRHQESKIRAVRFEHRSKAFSSTRSMKKTEGQEGALRSIADTRKAELLVVGDNPDSEIEVGNRLGIATVQIPRPGVPRGDNAKHHVSTLTELERSCGIQMDDPGDFRTSHGARRSRVNHRAGIQHRTLFTFIARRLRKGELLADWWG